MKPLLIKPCRCENLRARSVSIGDRSSDRAFLGAQASRLQTAQLNGIRRTGAWGSNGTSSPARLAQEHGLPNGRIVWSRTLGSRCRPRSQTRQVLAHLIRDELRGTPQLAALRPIVSSARGRLDHCFTSHGIATSTPFTRSTNAHDSITGAAGGFAGAVNVSTFESTDDCPATSLQPMTTSIV